MKSTSMEKAQTTTDEQPLVAGGWYRIRGELGTYKLMSETPNKDGSLNLYGGSGDYAQFRCVMPSRLFTENRASKKAVQKRVAAGKVKRTTKGAASASSKPE